MPAGDSGNHLNQGPKMIWMILGLWQGSADDELGSGNFASEILEHFIGSQSASQFDKGKGKGSRVLGFGYTGF